MTGPETQDGDRHGHRQLRALTELAESDPPSEAAIGTLCAEARGMLRARGVAVVGIGDTPAAWALVGSDPRTRALVDAEFSMGEGPCLDAWRSGEPVWDRCADADGRWPRWSRRAVDDGIDGVLTIPLGAGGSRARALGALWLAFERAEWLEDHALRWVAGMASLALRELARHRDLEEQRKQVAQLEHALESRVLIEQAKGYVAAREGVSPEEAFERLRRQARSSQRRLRDIAEETLRGVPAGSTNGSRH